MKFSLALAAKRLKPTPGNLIGARIVVPQIFYVLIRGHTCPELLVAGVFCTLASAFLLNRVTIKGK